MNKKEIIDKFKRGQNDTGSTEVQIALATTKIKHLSAHATTHKKDNHSKRGLTSAVAHRKRLLNYLKNQCVDRYKAILSALELRK